LAKVKQLGTGGGALGNVSRIMQISVTLTDVMTKLQDLRRHLSQVEDRVHTANAMNTANRQLIIRIQVLRRTFRQFLEMTARVSVHYWKRKGSVTFTSEFFEWCALHKSTGY